MKKLLLSVLIMLSSMAYGQSVTRRTPMLETDNVFTGNNQFTKGVRFGPKTLVNLPDPVADGTIIFCADCQTADPCVAGGPGAFAHRVNNSWACNIAGSGSVGPGTVNTFPIFGSSTSIVDSILSQSGGTVVVGGNLSVASNLVVNNSGYTDIKSISAPSSPSATFSRFYIDANNLLACKKSDGSSCGPVGPGTIGKIPVFSQTNQVGDSVISQSVTAISINGSLGVGSAPTDTFDVGGNFHINSTGYADIRGISTPANPASGFCRMYVNTSGSLVGLKPDGTSCLTGGGGGSPGSPDTSVQFASGGSFAGSANLTFVSPILKIGVAGSATGQIQQTGSTSGTVTVTPQAVAGTVTLTYPNQSGTFAVSANAPIVLSSTSGAISCPTCAVTNSALSQFTVQTTSTQFAGIISDETGSGAPGGVLVFNNSPTIVTPTIASFINATHNHSNAVNGGQLTDAAFSTAVGFTKGGTGQTTAPDDTVLLGNGSGWQLVSLPTCPDTGGNHWNYDASTNTVSCGNSGGGVSGANQQLSNLASVAFNADLVPGANNARDLGSVSAGLRTGYFATSILSPFFSTNAASPATVGLVRGTNNSTLVAARNAANSADCTFGLNSSDQFSTNCPITSTGTSTFIEIGDEQSATTGAANTARITYNDTTGKLRVSLDAASAVTVATSAEKLSLFAATTSAELAGVLSDEVGTGFFVLQTSPTLVTPVLGVATATSINKVAITAPASSATLTIADGKTLTVNNTMTLAGTDSQTYTFPATSATMFGSTTKHDVIEAGEFCADAGANDTYTCNLSPAITAYVTGTHYRFSANTANTGAASINFNSLGAKTIVKYQGGVAQTLADNDIRAGAYVETVYDGTNMQLVSILGNSSSSSGDVTDVGDCTSGACFSSGGAGTVLTLRNATSGTVALQTVTGALGTVTVSLPAATTTLVGKDTTDTLSNKTLDNTTVETVKDTNHSVVDDGDVTKIFKFQISSITTGTTRTWTVPDSSDTFVGLAATQTLTNKTLTTPIISSISNTGTVTLPTATTTLVGRDTTDTLTNKTIDAEGTGNSITTVEKFYVPAAGCQNATSTLLMDSPTTNAATSACNTGTNTQKGYAVFVDGANSISLQTSFLLPADWTGALDAKIRWFSSVTSGNVVWQVATICVADGSTSDPAYNTASTATDAAKGTTLQDNDATITSVTTTGCSAGNMMYVKIFRDPANGSDTMAGDANLRGVEFTLRRAQ
jgi:hypothetical protein